MSSQKKIYVLSLSILSFIPNNVGNLIIFLSTSFYLYVFLFLLKPTKYNKGKKVSFYDQIISLRTTKFGLIQQLQSNNFNGATYKT